MRLFGREAESRIFDEILESCGSKSARILLISGQQGVGKSALLESLAGSAGERGFKRIQARYARGALSRPGSAWGRIIRACSRVRCINSGIAEFSASENARDLTSVGPSHGAASNGSSDHLGDADDSPAIAVVRQALLTAASVSPILITLDDLHDADEFSLDLLAYLGDMLPGARILVAGAYRSSGFRDTARRRLLRAIERHAHNIELNCLSDAAIEETLGDKCQEHVDRVLVDKLRKLTGGNPRLLVECYPLLSETAELIASSPGSIKIPLGVVSAVEERLETLTDIARQLLTCGSVIGNQFDSEVAARIAGADRDEALMSLRQLEEEGLLRATDASGHEFVHGFVREVLYRGIPNELKASMHRRAALAMESRFPRDLAAYAEPIAQNLLRSRELSAVGDAINYAQIAISRFIRVGSMDRASEMVSMIRNCASGDGHRYDSRIYEILTEWGIAQRDAGDLSGAERTFREAISHAQNTANPDHIARLAVELPDYHWPLPGSSSPLALLLAENAIQSLGGKETELLALVTARLAAELSYERSQKQRSRQLARLAVKIAENTSNDLRVKLRVLRFVDCTLRHPDDVEERMANLDAMTSLAKQVGEMPILWEASIASICSLLSHGKIDEAEKLVPIFEEAGEIAKRPLYSVFTVLSRAARAALQNRPADCEGLFNQFRQAAHEAGIAWAVNRCWPTLVLPLLERESLAELEPMAKADIHDRPQLIVDEAMTCWLNARLGDRLQARMQLERLAINDFADVRHCADFLAAAAAIGEACTQLANVEHHARRIYDLLLPYADRDIVLGQIAAFGSAAYYLGRLAKVTSRPDVALEHFEHAAGRHLQAKSASWILYGAFELAVAKPGTNGAEGQTAASDLLLGIQSEAAQREMRGLQRQVQEFQSRVLANGPVGFGRSSNDVSFPLTFEIEARGRESVRAVELVMNSTKSRRVFRREDDFWILGYENRLSRVRHRKGLLLISLLLHKPYEPIHVFDLAEVVTQTTLLVEDSLQRVRGTEIGPILDSAAKRSYRERARELRQELEEARQFNDLGRVAKLEEELQFLTRELAQAVGLFGRDRANGSSNERARLRVTNAIKSAIAGIMVHNAPLASHLNRTVKTGSFCAYRPDVSLDWEL